MLRRPLAVFLTLITLGFPADPPHGSTTLELLVERPPQSLRGEIIDLDNRWNSARLLAHFGENRLAYELVRSRPPNKAIDQQIERFEARLLTEMGLVERADSVLALQSYSGADGAYYRLCLRRSRLNLMAGEYDRALGFLALIDTLSFPAFDPYKDYLAMECLSDAQRFEEAYTIGEARLALGIPVSLSPRFEEELLDAYMSSDEYEKAHQFVEVIKARRNGSSAFAPVLIKEIDILFQIGDSTRALERAVELIHDRRTRRQALIITEDVAQRVRLDELASETLLEFCDVLLRGSNLAVADRIITILSERRLTPQQQDQHTALSGDLYFREKRYSKSYKLLRVRFADASLERRATLLRARIYRKTGQVLKAAEEYVTFAKKYPYDAKAAEALLVASGLYMRVGDSSPSMELLRRINETYPGSRHARTATMRRVAYHIERKDYTAALEILTTAVERSRRRNEELLYYLADTYDRMGESATADKILQELYELDPISFYLAPAVEASFAQPIIASNGRVELDGERGLLQFLKKSFHQREATYENIRAVVDEVPESTGKLEASALYLERGRQFLQMGFRDWAEIELRVLESNYKLPPKYWFELGVLYDDFAMHWKSVRAFQRVYYALPTGVRESLDGHFRLLMYPLPYPALVFENCSRNGISPHLVYAMMREESRFDLNAVSRAGAMGLMQLMPSTGAQVAGQLGFPKGPRDNLLIPEINVTFGIWYASHLLSRTNGDPLMMLSAYNAGLGNAKRWFRGGGGDTAVINMVDGIDYGETRDYVKKIVESAKVYHALYFDANRARDDSPH
jgi:soluble lytic murein transglycosylase